MTKHVYFDWGMADNYGWGVYGLNLALHGAASKSFRVVPLEWPPKLLYPLDPFSDLILKKYEQKSATIIPPKRGDFLLSNLGNGVHRKPFSPIPTNVGVTFFEVNPLPIEELIMLKQYAMVVAGSSWNYTKLCNARIRSELVIQGVNTELFTPMDKRYFKDRFVVFSGGKLEYRKGQDIALKAFSIFSQKHKDAFLVTAWRSPWEQRMAKNINASNICTPLVPSADMHGSICKWIEDNGVPEDQYHCLDAVPNRLMPDIFREVDLGLFTSRCEGGTNLVAMEALSSGVTCAVSANTGQLDLVKLGNCIPLKEQGKIANDMCREWGETSVEELLSAMESAYDGQAKQSKEEIRNPMLDFTWPNAIDKLFEVLARI